MSDASHDLTAQFDDFYRDARDRLLLQSFALTGDIAAARSGVRDAFVLTWHHWRKTSRLDDPEAKVRALAWDQSLRRASARRWRREESTDPAFDATLDAVAELPVNQRKILLLTQLAGLTLPDAAQEVGITAESAERELAAAAAVFVVACRIEASQIHATLAALAPAVEGTRWPRVTIIRRAGSARRRTHTVLGVAAVVGAMAVTGVAVTDPTGVRPTLDREPDTAPSGVIDEPQIALPDTALLPVAPIRQALGAGRWQQGKTDDNSEGNGQVLPCQRQRYADPRGTAAWVRRFQEGPKDKPTQKLVQSAEASRTPNATQRTYDKLLQWYAGCTPRPGAASQETQLIATYDVAGVGEVANLFVLRSHDTATTQVIGVARTGLYVTSLALGTGAPAVTADPNPPASLLAAAVKRLCDLPDGGDCTDGKPRATAVPALPAGPVTTLLSEWDMPAVGDKTGAWSATRPSQLRGPAGILGVVNCTTVDMSAGFEGKKFEDGASRSLVLPDAGLPVEFGLTQASGTLPGPRAAAWFEKHRQQITECPDTDAGAGTEVRSLARITEGKTDLVAWQMQTDLPDDRTISYDMALVRNRGAVSVLMFVSVPRAEINDESFVALARRAVDRLGTPPADS